MFFSFFGTCFQLVFLFNLLLFLRESELNLTWFCILYVKIYKQVVVAFEGDGISNDDTGVVSAHL